MEKSQGRHKIAFFGTPRFAAHILEHLLGLNLKIAFVAAQPSAMSPKGSLIEPPVISFAKKHALPFVQPSTLKDQKLADFIRKNSPEAIIVAAYGKIIPASLLEIPSKGWINVHASLLPRYRGASPIQAAILNGDLLSGVTLMRINEGLDTGDIIFQEEVTVSEAETTPSLTEKIISASHILLQKSLIPYLDGKVQTKQQSDKGVSLTKEIQKENGRIDWAKPAQFIERMVRAYKPWPGVFFEYQQKRITLHALSIGPVKVALPGTVFSEGEKLLIACGGNTSIQVEMLQREGKKILPVKEFLLGTPIVEGARLT